MWVQERRTSEEAIALAVETDICIGLRRLVWRPGIDLCRTPWFAFEPRLTGVGVFSGLRLSVLPGGFWRGMPRWCRSETGHETTAMFDER